MLTEVPWRDLYQEYNNKYRALDVDSSDSMIEKEIERQRPDFYLAWLEYIADFE